MSIPTGRTDGQTDGRQTLTLRFPLDAARVIIESLSEVRNWQLRGLAVVVRFFVGADGGHHDRVVGSSGEEEHWSLCVADAESVLSFAVGAMFVRQEFDGNSKHSASTVLTSTIQAQYQPVGTC